MKYLQNVFQGRSLLKCMDYTPAELNYLIDFALHLFEKSSTRTRSAFVVACNDLGANPEYMGVGEIHLGKRKRQRYCESFRQYV